MERYILVKNNKDNNRVIIDTTKEKEGIDFGVLPNGQFIYHYEHCDILKMSNYIFDLLEVGDLIILDGGIGCTTQNIKGELCVEIRWVYEVEKLKDDINEIYKKDNLGNFIKVWEREE